MNRENKKEESNLKDIFEKNSIKVLKGIGISWVITFILLFIYAVLLTYTKIAENTMVPVIIFITAISILIRQLNCSRKYQKKWNGKWWDNWFYICFNNLHIIKFIREQFYFEYIFYNYGDLRNCSRCHRRNSRSKFKINNTKRSI